MNKTLRCFVSVICMVAMPAMAAVSIKKAAPVAMQQTSVQDGAGNLLGTVATLATGVMALTKQVNELNSECQPTSSERDFVDKMMKEWAKTGVATADEVANKLGQEACGEGNSYRESVKDAIEFGDRERICFDVFKSSGCDCSDVGDDCKIWDCFPKVGEATYCDDGTENCSKKKQKKTSNIYELFALITFTEADFTTDELKNYSKLKEKMEKCSGTKLADAQKALWGDFLVKSVGGVGQKTSTDSIMDAVSGFVGAGGGVGGLQSLTGFITNSMNQ